MQGKLKIAYFAHSLRSDWNNGNAHFLRGLMRALVALGHSIRIYEPEVNWSISNLLAEANGDQSLHEFTRSYPDLDVSTYEPDATDKEWRERLNGEDVVIVHEWNLPSLAQDLLRLRDQLGFRILFHDTHHRASSSPSQMQEYSLDRFDGILAFGEALRRIYHERFGIKHVWTLHEAADTTMFRPRACEPCQADAVWIGNWGDGERSTEIAEFFLRPAAALTGKAVFTIYGVRYPEQGLRALRESGVRYAGYLPNLQAPAVYAAAKVTVHIPRQQYTSAMLGIPTIRVFEALACGIPLLSAPWQDAEELFRPGDFQYVRDTDEMIAAMRTLLHEPAFAAEQARRGLETIRLRHTCRHRAEQLTSICEELLS